MRLLVAALYPCCTARTPKMQGGVANARSARAMPKHAIFVGQDGSNESWLQSNAAKQDLHRGQKHACLGASWRWKANKFRVQQKKLKKGFAFHQRNQLTSLWSSPSAYCLYQLQQTIGSWACRSQWLSLSGSLQSGMPPMALGMYIDNKEWQEAGEGSAVVAISSVFLAIIRWMTSCKGESNLTRCEGFGYAT